MMGLPLVVEGGMSFVTILVPLSSRYVFATSSSVQEPALAAPAKTVPAGMHKKLKIIWLS